ncbi:uncharacterized protein LOC111012065 [Momordica charantia]|uniref:Uncharacterized protein LOC111012065 n=1 Tax=Momordica charantia TaxID=3673 RepID=A0A6J1CK99_MOMCH|nr:uncharacterized protein LOC111012065 [Momordica charantia]
MDDHFLNLDFVKSLSESILYVSKSSTAIVIVSLYADDLLVIGSDNVQIEVSKQERMKVFEMTDLGLIHYFLGMEIHQGQNEVFLYCSRNCLPQVYGSSFNKVKIKLQKDDGEEPADDNVYKSLVGCLMYLTSTRPNIMYTGYSDSD